MISGFNKLKLASTVVLPLLLSIAIVVIVLDPSKYAEGWRGLFDHFKMPGFSWIMTNVFIIISFYSIFATRCVLKRYARDTQSRRSIKLKSLEPHKFNIVPIIAMIAPWATFLFKGEKASTTVILIVVGVVALLLSLVLSKHGYFSLVFELLGYNCYEGKNANGMPITLLSKRQWGSAADVCQVVDLTNEMALIV